MPKYSLIQTGLEYMAAGGWLMLPISLAALGIWFSYFTGYRHLKYALKNSQPEDFSRLNGFFRGHPGLAPSCAEQAAVLCENCKDMKPQIFQSLCQIEITRLKDTLLILGALVTAAPLLGLLGTVFGMIDTFAAVSNTGDGNMAVTVAGGIREALITTRAGLIAAIPGTFGLAHLTWLRYILAKRMQICADILIEKKQDNRS